MSFIHRNRLLGAVALAMGYMNLHEGAEHHSHAGGHAAPTPEAEPTKPAKAKKERDEEVVALSDGSSVTFVGKKQIIKTGTVGDDSLESKFAFRNGDLRVVRIDLTDPIIYRLALHGLEQKLGDEMAASSDKFSLEDKIMWFDELVERLTDTTKTLDQRWFADREGGGGVSGVSDLVRALMELTGKTSDEVKAGLNKQVEKQGCTKQALVQAMRNSPQIKPIIDRLAAERAAKAGVQVNVDDVLSAI